MTGNAPLILDFSNWDGTTPFFENQPQEGRHVYVVKKDDGSFVAYGVTESKSKYVFQLRGATADELERFISQVQTEGARVSYGSPPIETKTGGDKPPPTTTTPVGLKSDKSSKGTSQPVEEERGRKP